MQSFGIIALKMAKAPNLAKMKLIPSRSIFGLGAF